MADITSWAIGPIDPHGRVAAAFELLKVQSRARFEETQDAGVAQLHDALGISSMPSLATTTISSQTG